MNILNALRARIAYSRLFLRGDMSLALAWYLFRPSRWRPALTGTETFELYGQRLSWLPGEAGMLIALLYQIIGLDQYRIGLIKKGAVVIDAGANMGIFSIYAAAHDPQATIYAFEPVPSTFEVLKENTRHYPNIKIFNVGLGESTKTASMVMGRHSGGNHVGTGGIPVDIRTVDSYGLRVDFMKMDVEGYEGNVLKGARETIQEHAPTIVMSAYHHANDETLLPALVKSMAGYECHLEKRCEKDLVCIPVPRTT